MLVKFAEIKNPEKIISFLDKHENVQVFDASLFITRRHIEHCIQQTLKAFSQKRNISKSQQLEFLLILTGERQIKDALKKASAKKNAVFVSWSANPEKDYEGFKPFVAKELQIEESPNKELDAMQKSATFWLMD